MSLYMFGRENLTNRLIFIQRAEQKRQNLETSNSEEILNRGSLRGDFQIFFLKRKSRKQLGNKIYIIRKSPSYVDEIDNDGILISVWK